MQAFHYTDDENEVIHGQIKHIRDIRGIPFYLLQTPGYFQIVSETADSNNANYRTKDGKLWVFYEYSSKSPYDGMVIYTKEKDALSTVDDIENHPEWFSPRL